MFPLFVGWAVGILFGSLDDDQKAYSREEGPTGAG